MVKVPIPVLAARSPSDCFHVAIEAARIAIKYMTPVVVLSDTQIAIGSEPWLLPDVKSLKPIEFNFHTEKEGFLPYGRDENLARPWAIPGTPGLEHTIGGLEKENGTGLVNLSPDVHEEMVAVRAQKVANIANSLPPTEVFGKDSGDLLILGWGSTYGSIRTATENLLEQGFSVGQVHLRNINPLPNDLEEILSRFDKVLVPELNCGQLNMIIRSKFLIDAQGFNQMNTKPFAVSDLVDRAKTMLEANQTAGV